MSISICNLKRTSNNISKSMIFCVHLLLVVLSPSYHKAWKKKIHRGIVLCHFTVAEGKLLNSKENALWEDWSTQQKNLFDCTMKNFCASCLKNFQFKFILCKVYEVSQFADEKIKPTKTKAEKNSMWEFARFYLFQRRNFAPLFVTLEFSFSPKSLFIRTSNKFVDIFMRDFYWYGI